MIGGAPWKRTETFLGRAVEITRRSECDKGVEAIGALVGDFGWGERRAILAPFPNDAP